MDYNKHKIIMTGGGTGGPVTPLLAVADLLRKTDPAYEFLWLGTTSGPEKAMVEAKQIPFSHIASGKWRRYFSLQNFFDIFNIIFGFVQSLIKLSNEKPGLVMSAGGFVSVPIVWAAWILRIPVFIHQQDVRPGLANKLMSPFAKVITVTFEKSLNDYGKKALWTGNPVRTEFKERSKDENKDKGFEVFSFKKNLPVILVVGGGTGSLAINMLLTKSLPDLTKYAQVIHVTGAKNTGSHPLKWVDKENSENYKAYDFLDEYMMSHALHIADVVISRCGMGFLTELSFLEKASILLPLPDSHQIDNANLFREKEAAMVLDQNLISSSELTKHIKKLLRDDALRRRMQDNISSIIKKDAEEYIVNLISRV